MIPLRRMLRTLIVTTLAVTPGCAVTRSESPSQSDTSVPSDASADGVVPAGREVELRTATLFRDEWGVPHIYSDDLGAGMFAVGYAQAEDRLSAIFEALRISTGRMAEAYGPGLIRLDTLMHISRNEEMAREAWESASPEMKIIATNFVDGINAYVAEHPEARRGSRPLTEHNPGGHDVYREHNPLITAARPEQRLGETLGKIGPDAARAPTCPVMPRAPTRDSTAPPPRSRTAPTTPQPRPKRNNAAECLPAAWFVNL